MRAQGPARPPVSQEAQMILSLSARDQAEEIQKMIEQGADPTAVNGLGQSALHVACLWGHHKCVEVLIKAGAKLDLRNSITGATPLHMAALDKIGRGSQEGRDICVRMLLAAGASPDTVDFRGDKPYKESSNPEIRVALGGPADPAEDDERQALNINNPAREFVGCALAPSTRSWKMF